MRVRMVGTVAIAKSDTEDRRTMCHDERKGRDSRFHRFDREAVARADGRQQSQNRQALQQVGEE